MHLPLVSNYKLGVNCDMEDVVRSMFSKNQNHINGLDFMTFIISLLILEKNCINDTEMLVNSI